MSHFISKYAATKSEITAILETCKPKSWQVIKDGYDRPQTQYLVIIEVED